MLSVELSLDFVANVVNKGNLGRRKFFKFVMEILRDMRTKGISLDLETLSIVLDSFVRAPQGSKAIQMFGNVEEFGLKCDTEGLNVLLQCARHWGLQCNDI